jgi:hypothetical protein
VIPAAAYVEDEEKEASTPIPTVDGGGRR